MNCEICGKPIGGNPNKIRFASWILECCDECYSINMFNKGVTYKNNKKFDLAILYFKKSIEYKHYAFEDALIELDKCYLKYGNEYANNKNYEKAIELYDKSLGLYPDSYITLYNKAKALYLNNQKKKALNLFKHIIKLYPENTKIPKHIE